MSEPIDFIDDLRGQIATAERSLARRAVRRRRTARSVGALGVAAALTVGVVVAQRPGDDTPDVSVDPDPPPVSTVTTDPPSTTSMPAEERDADDPLAAWAEPDPPLGTSEIRIDPAGPYDEGQEVALLVRADLGIDVWNSPVRLCARVGGGTETCDPTPIRPGQRDIAVAETRGITISLPQRHFGPEGDRDCADVDVSCRLLWVTDQGRLLASAALEYTTAAATPESVQVVATPRAQPGVVSLQISGLDTTRSAAEAIPPDLLAAIEHATRFSSVEVKAENITVTWHAATVCSFATGSPPIGADPLLGIDEWWEPVTLVPDSTDEPLRWLGPNCEYFAPETPLPASLEQPVEVEIDRDIYGFGGWVDCATQGCYLELTMRWRLDLPEGGSVGDEIPVVRTTVQPPTTWPSSRPSIVVDGTAPFAVGDAVTARATGLDPEQRWAIAFCEGHWWNCGYWEADQEGDATVVTVTIPPGCATEVCYFAVDSVSEGLAPSTVLVIDVANP